MPRLIRITTVPISLHLLLNGQFSFMRKHGFDVITISADGPEVAEVTKDGTPHIVVPLTRKITPFQDLWCLLKLVYEIRKIKPHIVHTHTPKAGLLGMVAAWICKVPVRMHTVAGLPLMEASGIKRRVLESVEQITYKCAHKVYPNSIGLKRFIHRELGVPNEKLSVIGKGSSNGINTSVFCRSVDLEKEAQELRVKYAISDKDFIFCFVGRLVADKGINELVKAFLEISNEVATDKEPPNEIKMYLLLVGNFEDDLDPLKPETLEAIRNRPDIISVGFQKDVRPYIIASNVFVFPSYREGFPNVVMQAAMLGSACIVSDIPGCNEIIEDGISGIIVPPKNVEKLKKAMTKLAYDVGARSQFSSAAREKVAANFKQEVLWEGLRAEYLRLLKN